MRVKRISFNESDAAHIYDLALNNFQVSRDDGICVQCKALNKRLEKFIGRKDVVAIKRRNKEYPYKGSSGQAPRY